jgi:hypothetical protein
MSSNRSKPHGLLAEFHTAADIFEAAIRCRDAGFTKWDVYTPFPIHGMDEAMGLRKSPVGWFTFCGGFTGFFTGMTMIWYMNKFDYPLVVGGKPLFTPLFAFPVSYEMTILLSAFGTLFGMFFLNKLPRFQEHQAADRGLPRHGSPAQAAAADHHPLRVLGRWPDVPCPSGRHGLP